MFVYIAGPISFLILLMGFVFSPVVIWLLKKEFKKKLEASQSLDDEDLEKELEESKQK